MNAAGRETGRQVDRREETDLPDIHNDPEYKCCVGSGQVVYLDKTFDIPSDILQKVTELWNE